MRLDDAQVGQRVAYWPDPHRNTGEYGYVTSTNDRYVFVRFDGETGSKACSAEYLSPIRMPRAPEDRYSNTEADAGRYENHVGPVRDWVHDNRPTRAEIEADEQEGTPWRRR